MYSNVYDGSRPDTDELLKAFEQLMITDEFKLLINAKLRQCPYIAIDELQNWEQDISRWDTDAALALLLSLLPNLQSIHFFLYRENTDRLKCVIDSIVQATRASPGGLHALGKLSKLEIDDSHFGNGENIVHVVRSFAELPSMRSFHGYYLEDNPDASQLLSSASSITDINIEYLSINSKFLETLLGCVRSLENFRCKYFGFGGALRPSQTV